MAKQRFVAPTRAKLDRSVFDHPVFAEFEFAKPWLQSTDWPGLVELNDRLSERLSNEGLPSTRLVAQTPGLLADGLHYEQRIAEGRLATREENWHDLLNALIWMRHPAIKRAMNARQCRDIALVGSKQRTRAQAALTHFDEAGAVVVLRDAERTAAWDRHDWAAVFMDLQAADIAVSIVGHALLEHRLEPDRLLVGKAWVWFDPQPQAHLEQILQVCAEQIAVGSALNDPLDLRPFPMMGLPGWHADAGQPAFYREAPCFQPVRAGRTYPDPSMLVGPTEP
ncbi:DUF3025 domain-containing protein [Pseudomarimonas arenosa]|uniref:DUF3025 domain-containing protein n=1 Tax=Pseudomarimonas arenosa TaxID=2774145 RepID=UPI001CDC0AB0|nr:DUF3025 domain-containing protein [Pseudomarimonas arenosa]